MCPQILIIIPFEDDNNKIPLSLSAAPRRLSHKKIVICLLTAAAWRSLDAIEGTEKFTRIPMRFLHSPPEKKISGGQLFGYFYHWLSSSASLVVVVSQTDGGP